MALPDSISVQTSRNPGTARLSFTDGDTLKRFTIADAAVTTLSSVPTVQIVRDTIADVDDPGWLFVVNVCTLTAGSFDVLVGVLAGDAFAAANEFPNEVVTLVYHLT